MGAQLPTGRRQSAWSTGRFVFFLPNDDGARRRSPKPRRTELILGDGRRPRRLAACPFGIEPDTHRRCTVVKRWLFGCRAILNEIIEPRRKAMGEGRIYREREPIGIRRKDFWEVGFVSFVSFCQRKLWPLTTCRWQRTQVSTTAYLLSDKFRQKLSHEPDGLIFQPVREGYVPGTCPEVRL